jgi:hypothetical protein
VRSIVVIIFVVLVAGVQPAGAVEQPLGDWVRAGRFIPVRDGMDASSTLPAFPDERLPTTKLLRDDQRLIVLDGASPSDATGLFPDAEIVTVDATIGGEPVAWEAADAVIFGGHRASVASRWAEGLLSNGSTVVVVAPMRPDGSLAWTRSGARWEARPATTGKFSRVDATAYENARLRPVGRPEHLRVRVVLLTGLVALVALAATLLSGPRAKLIGAVGVSVVGAVGLALWARGNSPIERTRVGPWTFDQSPASVVALADPRDVGWPVLRSPSDAPRVSFERRGGQVIIRYELSRGRPMAFVRR